VTVNLCACGEARKVAFERTVLGTLSSAFMPCVANVGELDETCDGERAETVRVAEALLHHGGAWAGI
jgi:hypothetical protein